MTSRSWTTASGLEVEERQYHVWDMNDGQAAALD
jgi:hypothetical protein